MGQHQVANGNFAFDERSATCASPPLLPEHVRTTVWSAGRRSRSQGKIGNFDLTYAYAHLKRNVDAESDYTDYGFWYDTLTTATARTSATTTTRSLRVHAGIR